MSESQEYDLYGVVCDASSSLSVPVQCPERGSELLASTIKRDREEKVCTIFTATQQQEQNNKTREFFSFQP